MTTTGQFHVQTRLILHLAALYRSSEEAIKELVANSWDADAAKVEISLPIALTGEPITVRDNGCGMTPQELEAQYLTIGFNRRSRGDLTIRLRRTVRGRLGIGKFAGFLVGDRMVVTTVARGTRSRLVLERQDIEAAGEDIQLVRVPIETVPCEQPAGTVVELSLLRPGFEQPSPKRLAAILLKEFGPRDDFAVFIDGDLVTPAMLDVKPFQRQLSLEDGAQANVTVWVTPKSRDLAEPGIVLRVEGRAVGSSSYFGLEDDPDIPRGALRRLYVEVNADQLRDHITADWGSVIENSTLYQSLQRELRPVIKEQLLQALATEEPETEEDFVRYYQSQLDWLPPSRRDEARLALHRVFTKFYGEAPEKRRIAAELVLNVFEQDRYWLIAQRLDAIAQHDLLKLAGVLRDWGLGEVAEVAVRAKQRLSFLDHFERLATAAETLEFKGVHPVLETNPWLVGDEYETWVSNKTLRRVARDFARTVYRGRDEKDRPDLVLVGGSGERYLVIELKRPSWEITRMDLAQAEQYRDTLRSLLPNGTFEILVLGGRVAPLMTRDDHQAARVSTYTELVQAARVRLNWLLDHIDDEAREAATAGKPRLEF